MLTERFNNILLVLIVNVVSNLDVNRLRENSGNGGSHSFSALANILRVRIRR